MRDLFRGLLPTNSNSGHLTSYINAIIGGTVQGSIRRVRLHRCPMNQKKRTDKALADVYASRPHPDLLYAGESRHFSAHHLLLETAKLTAAREPANSTDERRIAVTTIAIGAFALEAFANAAGEELLPRWTDFESLQPWAKLRLVAGELGLDPDPGMQPWQEVEWLTKIRNRIAHAKPEPIFIEQWLPAEDVKARLDGGLTSFPLSKLEKELTRVNALRAVRAVEAVKGLIEAALPSDKHFRFKEDAMSGAYENPPDHVPTSTVVPET